MSNAALALAVLSAAVAQAPAARARSSSAPPPLIHKIAVDGRGPLALVEVTRELWPTRTETGGGEAILDLALPNGSTLTSVEMQDGGRWRPLDPTAVGADHAGDLYRSEGTARGVTPAEEPIDDTAAYRLRLARGGARAPAPVMVRYRFASPATFSDGRYHLRFPAAPERLPPAADVTVATRDAADLDIAGARTPLTASAGGTGSAAGRASMRAGWEISWAPRDPPPQEGAPALDARLTAAAVSPQQTAIGFAVRGRPARAAAAPPTGLLLVVDRSRSVGLAGLSAERDLARRLLEALPPTVRFDVLFFDRGTRRLFPMSRTATREAIEAFETEMVPDRLQNGTDLGAALREAGALLRGELSSFGPRALLAIVTDGALPDPQDGAALDRALGKLPGLALQVAAFAVRPPDDDPVSPGSRRALHDLAGARGGLARELRSGEIDDAIPAALAVLDRGGDLSAVRLIADGHERLLADALAPGAAISGVITLAGPPPRTLQIDATTRGHRVSAVPRARLDPGAWLRGFAAAGTPGAPTRARILLTPSTIALVEPVVQALDLSAPPVKGSMDRMVMRNVLSLAYMPRARACYLDRTGATPALRDLAGRVRLAIDVVRGEVERATIESSTLAQAAVERCLREGAFAIDVPRAVRSDAPVTAVLNLVFRPHPPETKPVSDLGAVGNQIDLIVEEAQREAESANPPTSEPSPPNLFPTR